MRAAAFLSAAVLAAFAAAAPARAQDICLYGGPDAAADLACGPAYVAPARPAPSWSGLDGQPRAAGAGHASRVNGVAQSRILSGGPVAPARPALPSGHEYDAGHARAQVWPAPPSSGGRLAVEGAGPAPGAYGYAYESAEGGAFAWRTETPDGPAWAWAYETPDGWAYAWARDAAPAGAAPPAIEARPPDAHAHGPCRGPCAPHGHGDPHYHDWRYSDARLYGASWPRQRYLAETYYRESEWVTASAVPGRTLISCGACGAAYAHGGHGPWPAPAPHPGVIVSGRVAGGGAFTAGAASASAAAGASRSFRESHAVSQTGQAWARASGGQSVVAGAPFAPPAGAPVPPWGPPPQTGMAGPANAASAYAGAGAGARAGF